MVRDNDRKGQIHREINSQGDSLRMRKLDRKREMPVMTLSFQYQVTGTIMLLLQEMEKISQYIGFEGMIVTLFFFKAILFDEIRNLNRNVWQVIRNAVLERKGKDCSAFDLRGRGSL